MQITDADSERYEVPKEAVDIVSDLSPPSYDLRLYDVEWVSEPHFGLRVIRRSTRTVVYVNSIYFIFIICSMATKRGKSASQKIHYREQDNKAK